MTEVAKLQGLKPRPETPSSRRDNQRDPERDQLLNAMVEHAPNAIVRHDLELRCVYANAAFLAASGLSLPSLVGTLPKASTFLYDTQQYLAHLKNARDTGQLQVAELAWGASNGARRYSLVQFIPERDAAGVLLGVLSAAHDITELKLLQSKLEKAEELSEIGFWELDFETDIARLSSHACRMAGREPGWQPSSSELLQLHPPAEREAVSRSFKAAFAQRQTKFAYDYTLTRDGGPRRFHNQVEITYAPDGKPQTMFAVSQDVTQRHAVEDLLRKREQEFRVLVDNTPDTVARYDVNGVRTYANATLARMFNKSPEALIGKRPSDYVNSPASLEYEAILREATETGTERDHVYVWRPELGEQAVSHIRIVPERDSLGQVVSVLAVGRDITTLKKTESRLEESQRIAKVCHWEWDYESKRSTLSAVGLEVMGLPGNVDLTMEQFYAMIPADQRGTIWAIYREAFANQAPEIRFEHGLELPDGSLSETHNWVRFEYNAQGRVVRALGVTQDITHLKTLQRKTHQLAFYDPLTELPNRALLHDRLKQSLSEAAWRGGSVGLVLLDIDNFQKINDSLGYSSGDSMLKTVADRLAHALRDYDTVARLGGDEFAIIAPQIRQPSDLSVVAARLKHVFETPITMPNGAEVFVTASAGIALYPSDASEADELMAHADAAMNHAKSRGRNNFQFYARELTATALERLNTESDLRKGIERNELELFYQPKIDLASGQMVGAEALMRWRHPERGLVPPDRFIGIAEDTGLIIEMGEWALRASCLAAKRWNAGRKTPLKIAVNLSPRQFFSGDLVKTVLDCLEETGCPAEWIELEITESLLLNDRVDIRSMLNQLHDAGLSIAIDDFGTGYSALSYLTRFPVDTIKIDRSFVRDLTTNRDSAVLVQAIVTLSRSLRMELVAEGVETEEQRDHLTAWGCKMAQGYLFSKPIPEQDFSSLLAQWGPDSRAG